MGSIIATALQPTPSKSAQSKSAQSKPTMTDQPKAPKTRALRTGSLNRVFALWWRRRPGNIRGAIWILLAALFFSLSIALIKEVGQDLHITQILLVRQGVMFVTVLPVLIKGFPDVLTTRHLNIHMARVSLAIIAMLGGFSAVIHIPLADATAISFAKSFFITLFAIVFLKETVGLHRWAATCIGFAGVLIMVRPGADGLDPWALAAVASAAAAGLVMIILRYLSRFDQPITILAYQAIFVGIAMAVPGLWLWQAPSAEQWWMLVAIGGLSFLGQMCNIRAFKVGEATAIASLDYTRLLYATLLGAVLFSEWPSIETLIGALIIIAASLYTVWREAKRGRQLSRSADGRGYHQ